MNKQQEEKLNSYLVDIDVFDELGKLQHITGVVKESTCKSLAKSNHKMCEGRGILNFDNGKVFFDENRDRQVLSKWRRTCDCVSKKMQSNPDLIG